MKDIFCVENTKYIGNIYSKFAFTISEILVTIAIIGVVSALTLPTLIKNYQKHLTVQRLKSAYSMLYQAVKRSEADNGTVDSWNFDIGSQTAFMDKYLKPYMKIIKISGNDYYLSNGIVINARRLTSSKEDPIVRLIFTIVVDINGSKRPNKYGKDRFIYYIFGEKRWMYNLGERNVAQNYPNPGLYPDGYGFSRNDLKNDSYRGCNIKNMNSSCNGAFCTNLIMFDGWKISDDYDW